MRDRDHTDEFDDGYVEQVRTTWRERERTARERKAAKLEAERLEDYESLLRVAGFYDVESLADLGVCLQILEDMKAADDSASGVDPNP